MRLRSSVRPSPVQKSVRRADIQRMTTIAPPTRWTYAWRTVGIGTAIAADVFHGATEVGLIAAAGVSFVALAADIHRRTRRGDARLAGRDTVLTPAAH